MRAWIRAALGGAGGAAAVGLLTWSLRRTGVSRVDYGRIVGALLGSGTRARGAGRAIFLLNGPALALGYALAFRILPLRPSATAGALLGAGHGVVALTGVAAGPHIHPRPRRAGLTALSWRDTSTAATVLAGHVLFGAIVGAVTAGGGTVGGRKHRRSPAAFVERPGSAYLPR